MSDGTVTPTRRAGVRDPEHRTVSRVMSILELVVSHEPYGLRLADLAEAISAPKSSIHGLTRGLVATGYLREERGRYVQGAALAGLLSVGGDQMPTGYHRTLEELSRRWDETAVIATTAGNSVINLDVVESTNVIRAHPPLRERRPMWPGSYGKCFLAHMEPKRQASYINQYTDDEDERAAILREIGEIRSTRVAFNTGETDPQLFGVASPILSADGGTVNFCIGLAGPRARMPEDLSEIADSVRAAAESLSLGNATHR